MTTRNLVLWGVALCAAAGPLAAQKPLVPKPEPGDSVKLTFAWPVGLRAAVTHRRVQLRVRPERTDTEAIEVRCRMAVEDHPRGRRIGYSDFVLPASLDSAGGRGGPEALAILTTVFAPPIVVSDSGEMLGLADEIRYLATVRALLQARLDSLPHDSVGARTRAFVERFLTPEVLTVQAIEEWNALVGFWLDAQLARGEVLETVLEEEIPLFPGRPVPYHYVFSYEGRAPCVEGGPGAGCAVLDLVTQPDSAALRALLASLMQDLLRGTPGGSVTYRRLELRNHIRLLTEPRGLIPHRLEIEQRVTVVVEAPGQAPESLTQVRSRRMEFAYDRPPP